MPEMHPRIATLAVELAALTQNNPVEFTQWDRDRLMILKTTIRDLKQEGLQLDEIAERDRQYLFVEATKVANLQEAFYEKNEKKWAKRPYAKMSDDEARFAIRDCIRRKLRSGTLVTDIHVALQDEVGVTGVALSVHPKPVDGKLPDIGRCGRFQFQFMAFAASGAVIS